jgi:hypothetical protein
MTKHMHECGMPIKTGRTGHPGRGEIEVPGEVR